MYSTRHLLHAGVPHGREDCLRPIISRYEFNRCVERYRGHHWVRQFSCWDQYLAMVFAQVTGRDGLRDIARAHRLYQHEPFALDLKHVVLALDSTTIDLCLSVFPWAHFRTTKAAVKAHTPLDLCGSIPTFVALTSAKVHDVLALDWIPSTISIDSTASIGFPPFRRAAQEKPPLKIKSFYGQSANAVKTQIWIAISTYLLIAIAKKECHLPELTLHTLLHILEAICSSKGT